MLAWASYIHVPERLSRATIWWVENCDRSISRLLHCNPSIISHKYLVVPKREVLGHQWLVWRKRCCRQVEGRVGWRERNMHVYNIAWEKRNMTKMTTIVDNDVLNDEISDEHCFDMVVSEEMNISL